MTKEERDRLALSRTYDPNKKGPYMEHKSAEQARRESDFILWSKGCGCKRGR